jgi:hypothetical protein
MCEAFAADWSSGKKIRLIGRRGNKQTQIATGGEKEGKDGRKQEKLTPGMVCREVVLPHDVLVLVDHVQPGPGEHQPRPRHHAVQFRVGVPPPLLRYRGRSHHAEHACGVGGIAREEEKSWARTYVGGCSRNEPGEVREVRDKPKTMTQDGETVKHHMTESRRAAGRVNAFTLNLSSMYRSLPIRLLALRPF